jgi:hypothetical protein
VYVALLDGLPSVDGARLFLAAYLGAYALYVSKTTASVVLRLGRPSFYAKDPSP